MMRTMEKRFARLLASFMLFLGCVVAWAQNLEVHLDVQGMTCPLCVSMINKALRETPGVVSARTSLPKHEAVVVVQQGVETDTLIAAVYKTGYIATVKSVQEKGTQE